jgi:hypothetical protein
VYNSDWFVVRWQKFLPTALKRARMARGQLTAVPKIESAVRYSWRMAFIGSILAASRAGT